MGVGFEDDTFIVYSIQQGFRPIFRGLGHRSFVSQVKFDSFYAAESIRIKNEVEKEMEEDPTPNPLLPKLVKRHSKKTTISQLVR